MRDQETRQKRRETTNRSSTTTPPSPRLSNPGPFLRDFPTTHPRHVGPSEPHASEVHQVMTLPPSRCAEPSARGSRPIRFGIPFGRIHDLSDQCKSLFALSTRNPCWCEHATGDRCFTRTESGKRSHETQTVCRYCRRYSFKRRRIVHATPCARGDASPNSATTPRAPAARLPGAAPRPARAAGTATRR